MKLSPAIVWAFVFIPAGASAELPAFLNLQIGSVSVHVVDLLFLAWFVPVAMSVAVSSRRIWFAPSHAAAIALLVWATIGIAVGLMRSFNPTWILRDYRGFLFYAAAFPAAFEIRTRRSAEQLLKHLLLATTAYASLVVVLAVMPANSPLIRETISYWNGERRLHFQNTFYLPVGVGMAFALATFGRGRQRIVSTIALAPLFGAIILSQTRSALGATLLTLLVTPAIFFHWQKRRLRLSELAVLASAAGIVAVGVPYLLFSSHAVSYRLTEVVHTPAGVGSLLARATSFATAIELWREHPFVGWGLGKGIEVPWALLSWKPWLGSIGKAGQLPAIDNSVLTAAFKLGTIGVVLLIAVWVAIARDAVAAARRTMLLRPRSRTGLLCLGLMASLPGYFAVALVQSTLVTYRSIAVWMIIARSLTILSRWSDRWQNPHPGSRQGW